jgi:hypothetical protein
MRQVRNRRPDDRRGDRGADGGQGQRRPPGNPHHRRRGLQAALKQNDDQRNTAEQIGRLEIVKHDPTRPVLAGEHPQRQEHQ